MCKPLSIGITGLVTKGRFLWKLRIRFCVWAAYSVIFEGKTNTELSINHDKAIEG